MLRNARHCTVNCIHSCHGTPYSSPLLSPSHILTLSFRLVCMVVAPLGGSRRPSFPTSLPCCRSSDFICCVTKIQEGTTINLKALNKAYCIRHYQSESISGILDYISSARTLVIKHTSNYGRKRASWEAWGRRPICSVQAGLTWYAIARKRALDDPY